MRDERELAIHPIVTESVQHNARVSRPGPVYTCPSPFALHVYAHPSVHLGARPTATILACAALQLHAMHSRLTTHMHTYLPAHPHARTNTPVQTVSNIRALTASLFGVAAGSLGLESYPGFAFYLAGTAAVSALIFALKADGDAARYFYSPKADLWIGDMFGGLMSFVLTWTLFYGLCKA